MYLLQNNVRSKPKVKIGIARGIMLAYIKHIKNCKHKTASSVGKSIGNIQIISSASFWIVGLLGSLF